VTGPTRSSKSGVWPARHGAPPPASFFDAPRPPAGHHSILLDLGGLVLGLDGLDAGRAGGLVGRYRPYAREGVGDDDALRVTLGLEDREYFLEPPPRPELNPVFLEHDGGKVRYLGYKAAGWFDTLGGRGVLLLARGEFEPDLRAIENYVRAAVAWQAARRGGALVHAASAIRGGRGYLFYGESGAGKSTLAASDRRGRVVSDDLSLVLPRSGGGLDLVGSPFRGTYEGGEPVEGRAPLRAGFRIVQAPAAEVRAVPRVRALSELVGSLTFVAEAFGNAPELFASVERAFRDVPLAHLLFRKDDSYWDAIERAGLA
jgi:hypothetical protein